MTIETMISTLSKEGAKKKFPPPASILRRWIGLFFCYAFGMMLFFPIRPDFFIKINDPYFLIQITAIFLMMMSAAVSASYLALPDGNQKSWVRFIPFFPLILVFIILIHTLLTWGSAAFIGCLEGSQFACARAAFLFSVLPSAVIFYTIQKAAPLRYYWAGTMAGLVGSSMGYLLLLLVEPHENPAHLLIWHFFPVLVTIGIAMALGKKILGRWQR